MSKSKWFRVKIAARIGRQTCAEGDSFTETYLAGHNVINAHARAVSVYRQRYKLEQGGAIGMTLNLDWAEVTPKPKAERT